MAKHTMNDVAGSLDRTLRMLREVRKANSTPPDVDRALGATERKLGDVDAHFRRVWDAILDGNL